MNSSASIIVFCLIHNLFTTILLHELVKSVSAVGITRSTAHIIAAGYMVHWTVHTIVGQTYWSCISLLLFAGVGVAAIQQIFLRFCLPAAVTNKKRVRLSLIIAAGASWVLTMVAFEFLQLVGLVKHGL